LSIAIEVEQFTKYYGELLAVDHINFEVEQGEIFGFLGPNGAGKTTTVKMLIGISKPSEGSARIYGYDIQKETASAKELMGIVPEISNGYVELSTWDNLMLMGELYGVPKAVRESKAQNFLELLELSEKIHTKFKALSKGLKRRVILAMALLNDPKILFLDEPTSGLDVQSTRIIRDLIREFNKEGTTVFLTTHNIEEANQLCDRVAIINHGKIIAIDKPEHLKKAIQSAQSIEVAFNKSSNHMKVDLETIKGVIEVRKLGDKFRLYTSKIDPVLRELHSYATSNNLQFITINTLAPSLEDVFVRFTSKTNRK
jgi:ABC-2 type transport system ATP-binding protein